MRNLFYIKNKGYFVWNSPIQIFIVLEVMTEISICTCQRIIIQIFESHQIRFNRKATLIHNCEMNYSKEQLVNMVYAIGEAHGNCLLASRIYQANNPDLQRYPLTKCFVKLRRGLKERQMQIMRRQQEHTHAVIRIDKLTLEISDEISISKSVVHRTLKKNNFHPYHPEHHQFLTEQDCQKRVLFTDESSFANTGRENRHNYHHYADQNPRLMRDDDHQHRFKVNVWTGICGEYVIGPHFLEGNLTGNGYLQFLQNDLLQLQRHIPPDDLNSQWFQHDGAPAHSTLAKKYCLLFGLVDSIDGNKNALTVAFLLNLMYESYESDFKVTKTPPHTNISSKPIKAQTPKPSYIKRLTTFSASPFLVWTLITSSFDRLAPILVFECRISMWYTWGIPGNHRLEERLVLRELIRKYHASVTAQ
ncbi:hypothetical protein NQ315_014855 [Exocentrus adspersus]|uniref:Transposase n=1 Tax=Exocentrus adspersus TaxID=1586481 RepID=A0AAV8VLM1_9CUCU|nr:hypothetical protein NQ315_014855 [Exocentrus adspersus]